MKKKKNRSATFVCSLSFKYPNRKMVTVVGKVKGSISYKIIGKKGEDYVYEYEFRRLNKLNKPELANKIYKHCDNNDFPGWDITSYNSDGTKKYIEVKSSRKNKRSFTITSNEWNAAKREKEKYYIYIRLNLYLPFSISKCPTNIGFLRL